MKKSRSKNYDRLKFEFKTTMEAYRAYRFISFGVELGILPKVELMLNQKVLWMGWYIVGNAPAKALQLRLQEVIEG
jgi:hypothetical protein